MLTNENVGEILDLLIANYGDKAYPQSAEGRQRLLNLWQVMFADDDPREVLVAVKDCIATLTFTPKVADIKSRIAKNRLQGQLTEAEVGHLVRKAVENSSSKAEAKQEFDNLPKTVQRSVGSPSALRSWRSVGEEQFETVILSMVYRSYRIEAEREASYHALPSDIQQIEQWKIDGAPKPEALPAPEAPKFEEPKEWNRNREVSDDVKRRLADFLGDEE